MDDNRDGAASLAVLLTVMDNDARTAHDGFEAVELADAFRPDLIVLDIGLPKLNGYDACRRIRERLGGLLKLGGTDPPERPESAGSALTYSRR